jgi:UPF0271 protein
MAHVDLNCDLGEGAGNDDALMPLITSANIACGLHAGDEVSMRATVRLAQKYRVAIGAHPSLDDRENFGRKEMIVSPVVVRELVVTQIAWLQAIATEQGARMRHVKPHGALYNMAARDRSVADAIAAAVYAVDPDLILFGLSGSELIKAGRARGLRVANEVFADRTYQGDGSLTPRSQADAMIHESAMALAQVKQMIFERTVRARDGEVVPIQADTVCLHGDGAHAVVFAQGLNRELRAAGVNLEACSV